MRMLFKSLLLFFLTTLIECQTQDGPLIETPLGTIRGSYRNSYEGKKYAAFEAIPFAQPPVGDLRFKEPQQVQPWDGIRENQEAAVCTQQLSIFLFGTEDCLYLNVYSPREYPTAEDNLDVVVYIHGGGFAIGAGITAQPTLLADRDLMLVTINYRLAAFGFLCTMDGAIPCNLGMKDQVAALKWIQQYIKFFGGNPDSVTITGLSAGAASVHYHLLSPLSTGLFHRAFSMSGTALEPWALQRDPEETVLRIASATNCTASSNPEIVECLRALPVETLAMSSLVLQDYLSFPLAVFAPAVEPDGDGRFLTDKPYRVLTRGEINDVPWLASVTKDEGIMAVPRLVGDLEDLNENWDSYIHFMIDTVRTSADEDKETIAAKVRQNYFGNDDISLDTIKSLAKMFTDREFVSAFQKTTQIHASIANSSVYGFMLAYMGNSSYLWSDIGLEGVNHGDDNAYIFGSPTSLDEEDEAMCRVYLDLLESFVTTNKPKIGEINWDPISEPDVLTYLYIQAPNDLSLRRSRDIAEIEFWDSLPLNEYENEL